MQSNNHLRSTSDKDSAEAMIPLVIEFSKPSVTSIFLQNCLKTVAKTRKGAIIRFVFSSEPGYLVRSDLFARRLECCAGIERVESFIPALRAVPSAPFQDMSPGRLPDVLDHAIVGLLLLNIEEHDLERESLRMDTEFANRFSFLWLQPEPIPRRRIVWVQGRENIGVSRRAYEAAQGLGVSIVMIDNPGHWLEADDGPHAYLREAFIPVDIEVNQGFTQRIVNAVQGYEYSVDGLMTISDVRLPGVAKACELLGLPTAPFTAFQNAGDKARTRMLERDANESFTLSNAAELASLFESERDRQLNFPLVVKPSLGWNSDCVSKVWNREELVTAARRASERHAEAASPSLGVVVEPYIDGPEVDANLVLLDGEVVFFDIEDDFPTRGDATDAGMDDNFQETQVILPSNLPRDEIQLLCKSLHQSIRRQGFTSGVFHCEARVRHSTAMYTDKDGIYDMEKKKQQSTKEKSIYLHEINARPPGYLESVAVMLTVSKFKIFSLLESSTDSRKIHISMG